MTEILNSRMTQVLGHKVDDSGGGHEVGEDELLLVVRVQLGGAYRTAHT